MSYPLFCVQSVLLAVKKTKNNYSCYNVENERKMKRDCIVVEGYYYE